MGPAQVLHLLVGTSWVPLPLLLPRPPLLLLLSFAVEAVGDARLPLGAAPAAALTPGHGFVVSK